MTAFAVGITGSAALCLALAFVPRPAGVTLRLTFVEGDQQPVANRALPYSAYGGTGPNYEGVLQTDATGGAVLMVYPNESGSITLREEEDPRRAMEVRFAPWGPIVGGPPNGYKFSTGEVLAGNSNDALRIYWPGKRDLTTRRTEPLYVYHADARLERFSTTRALEVERGRFRDGGDVEFTSNETGESAGSADAVLEVIARGVDGTKLAVATGPYHDVAPDAGYEDMLSCICPPQNPRFSLYVRTRSGRYAVLNAEARAYSPSSRQRGEVGAIHLAFSTTPAARAFWSLITENG